MFKLCLGSEKNAHPAGHEHQRNFEASPGKQGASGSLAGRWLPPQDQRAVLCGVETQTRGVQLLVRPQDVPSWVSMLFSVLQNREQYWSRTFRAFMIETIIRLWLSLWSCSVFLFRFS